ncbi:hypothetical protein [Halobacillus ihumii]|uniref:hypothetical protein n=1 Tax=Halobacillus ihumii TaxID=2686092 RepID=UPI0013D400F2|nr:hypothetical protein [Halobacillus ihumii]
MRKNYYVGAGLLLSCLILGLLMVLNNSSNNEEKITVNGVQFEKKYMKDLRERSVELIHFIEDELKEREVNVSLEGIEYDVKHFPRLLIYMDSNTQKDSQDIEKMVSDIVQVARTKSLLQEIEAFEVIVRDAED